MMGFFRGLKLVACVRWGTVMSLDDAYPPPAKGLRYISKTYLPSFHSFFLTLFLFFLSLMVSLVQEVCMGWWSQTDQRMDNDRSFELKNKNPPWVDWSILKVALEVSSSSSSVFKNPSIQVRSVNILPPSFLACLMDRIRSQSSTSPFPLLLHPRLTSLALKPIRS